MILPLEKQVCNEDLSQRLWELDVPQESIWYWVYQFDTKRYLLKQGEHYSPKKFLESVSAFTVAEFGELFIKFDRQVIIDYNPNTKLWDMDYHIYGSDLYWEDTADTEANARAKTLIHFLEKGIVKL